MYPHGECALNRRTDSKIHNAGYVRSPIEVIQRASRLCLLQAPYSSPGSRKGTYGIPSRSGDLGEYKVGRLRDISSSRLVQCALVRASIGPTLWGTRHLAIALNRCEYENGQKKIQYRGDRHDIYRTLAAISTPSAWSPICWSFAACHCLNSLFKDIDDASTVSESPGLGP
jgi:hypothetical protein